MIATVTSKGQVTLPKGIRDALNLRAGSKLECWVSAEGLLTIRALNRSIDSIIGMARRPRTKATTIQEMNDAVGDALAEKNDRIVRAARARRRSAAKAA